jgi:sortase A
MRRAWQWLRILAGTLVVAAATGAGAVALGPRAAVTNRPVPAAVTAPAPPTSTSPPGPVEPPLPTPEASPGDGFAPVAIVARGEISIPKIGLATTYYEGVEQPVLAAGPGHWRGTAAAGGWGNMVVAAHRVSHGAWFRRINELVPDDAIVVTENGRSFTWVVTGSEVVTPTDLWIVDQHPGRTLTLFACHPLESSSSRYVVHAQLA